MYGNVDVKDFVKDVNIFLYKDTKILILDEATSALDNKTEDNIMKAINNLSKDITIIMIAHRLSTLEICDRVITIENGKIV